MLRRLVYISGLAFEAVPNIESGGERFVLPTHFTTTTMETYTQMMFHYSSEREQLKARWETALAEGWQLSMPLIVRRLDREPTEQTLSAVVKHTEPPTFWQSLLRGNLPAYFQTRAQRKQWQKDCVRKEILANCVQKTLHQLGEIGERKVRVTADQREFSCYLEQAGYREAQLFTAVVQELFASIENPRYLLEGKKLVLPVPERFGRNKQTANLFLDQLNKQSLPSCQLVYTRNAAGRKKLVAYRMAQVFHQRDEEIIQKNIWT